MLSPKEENKLGMFLEVLELSKDVYDIEWLVEKVEKLNEEVKNLIIANNELAEEVTALRFLNNACKCNPPQRTSIEEFN